MHISEKIKEILFFNSLSTTHLKQNSNLKKLKKIVEAHLRLFFDLNIISKQKLKLQKNDISCCNMVKLRIK